MRTSRRPLISCPHSRTSQAAIFVSFIIVDTFAALLFAQKFSAWGDNDTFESVRNWFKAQLSLACAFFAAMLACGAYWARRVHQCRTERKTWCAGCWKRVGGGPLRGKEIERGRVECT